ncbi:MULTISPECIES: methyltransferase domain-containing protein [unclassified Bradyrhizobium]|uniref:methyltransferase domain-containing protein n=1 Tax=unclassified Bradyrhizobium TaxID=2631580 RepID=UPI001FF80817|nr:MULTISPECIES: methyltransferase domain-containing protein [unclassified Bradyrhizobium]MCK1536894.1 methyltransferase domain-containing protein [Bradyrhizobium sp. 176]MCK1560197.1 methyltransferase domain-containing protein [Bradyrhizobium sp. 171]
MTALKKMSLLLIPPLRRLKEHRDIFRAETEELKAERTTLQLAHSELLRRVNGLNREIQTLRRDQANARSIDTDFVEISPIVLQYRRAHFEVYGTTDPQDAMPDAKAWPNSGDGLSYRDKLTGLLGVEPGRGAEIGPLNDPLLFKPETNVLYVDHLDTAGLREKYKFLNDIHEVDRPMINNSLADTLAGDAPLDYVVASQVMEHVPNPIRWMLEISAVLRDGGLLSISLPDRRMTFDLYRHESRASDMITAFFQNHTVPDVRAVYDHHSEASAVNMHWALPNESVYPHEVVNAKGALSPRIVASDHMEMTRRAQSGEYLDVHCWVFTPVSFLLLMAQIAGEGLLPFRLRQFYPTDSAAPDRGNHSFTTVLEKSSAPATELRSSFLEALA